VAAGLDHICISIEALDREGYLELAGVAIDYAALLENIADLYQHRGTCEVYIKIVDVNLSEAQKERFYANFQPISTHVGIEKLMGWSNSGTRDFTLGTMPDTYDGLPFVDKEVCAYPFYVLAVNSDGTVSVCGNDWSQQTVVGSVLNNSLMEIWHSRELLEFRMMMLDGQRSRNGACGDCYYLKIVPDNIDQYASMLKSRLLKAHNSGCRDCADD
jgi:radical SAM protein with 4Fe4S-binding SPASM domain